jgi:hypothetical protein
MITFSRGIHVRKGSNMFIIAGRSLEVYLRPPSSLHIPTKHASFASRTTASKSQGKTLKQERYILSSESHGNNIGTMLMRKATAIGVDGDRRGRRSQCCAERGWVQKY